MSVLIVARSGQPRCRRFEISRACSEHRTLVTDLARTHNGGMRASYHPLSKSDRHPVLRHSSGAGRLLPLLIVCLALMTVVTVASSCGDGSAVDPKVVLREASANMKKIKGFHFVYEVHKPASAKPGTGLEIARITGDINAEGSMQATIDVTQGGIPLQLGFVAMGDTHYIQDPLSKKWQSIAADKSPVGSLSLSAGTIRILERITETSFEGQESKGGAQTYHIAGKAAAEDVAAIAGAVDTTNSFPTDIWVGVSDSLVYEVDIAGPATPNEDAKIWRSIILSNLDTFVDIKAPQ